uniref:Sex determination protein fox-1 n=1 Tax=Ascaris suum TaxID=6253 RepID=F1L9H8_ASCSU
MTDDASLRLQLQLISPMACFTRHADSPCADVLTMLPSMSMNSSDEAPERLFVGNIPSWFRDSDLRSLFGKYGPITDAHIVLSEQGTAEYGFVTMKNAASVEKARRELHRSWLEGRHLKVKRAVNVTSTGMHSNAPDIIEANSEVVTTLQNSALQQADAANHTIHLQNSLAEMIAMRNMQMLEMQRQLAVLGAQQELLYLGWPAANVQNSNSFLGNIQLLLDLQQAQNALIIEETCWQLAVAQAENRLILAAALEHGAATAAANVDANNAGIAAVDEQYPALPLMGAFHGYQTSSIPHSYVSRFSPY